MRLATTRTPSGEDEASLQPGQTVVLHTGDVAYGETIDGRLEFAAQDGSGVTYVDELDGVQLHAAQQGGLRRDRRPVPAGRPRRGGAGQLGAPADSAASRRPRARSAGPPSSSGTPAPAGAAPDRERGRHRARAR